MKKYILSVLVLLFVATQSIAAGPPPFILPPAGAATTLEGHAASYFQVAHAYLTDIAGITGAAGDVIYFNGTHWVKLAKDVGKYLKSGASAVSWDTPSGSGDISQSGSPANHYWAYFTADKTVTGVSITASKPVCSDANGDPAVCAGTEGVWQVAGSYLTSTTIDDTKGNGDTAYVWSADKVYDQLALKLSLATATGKGVYVASAASTPAFVESGAVTTGVFGISGGTFGFYSTIQLDDSAAQFVGATAGHIGYFKVNLSGSTTDKTMTIASSHTDDRTLTLPDASGTVALVKVEKIAVFNIDGTAADNTVVDSYVPVASTITGVLITTTGTACSAVVDIWSDTYANFPATNADTITASAPPTLSTAQKNKDTTLSGWTTAIPADTVLRANLDSSDCAGMIQVTLFGTK